MKRMFPTRIYGKFVCYDGLHHEWFMPVIKTFVHYIKAMFWDKNIQLDLKDLVQNTTFPERSQEPVITWLGHATFLIQIGNKNILTDPIFGSLSSVFRRLVPPIVTVQDLPPIDYVLISHNHFDHMDSSSLLKLKARFPSCKILVPMGDKNWFDKHSFEHVSEHMWWDEIIDEQNNLFKCIFLPANHWSQRTLFDKNRSLWGSWMIQFDTFKIYFAGDTSWGIHFKQIGDIFESVDVALLPIAPGEPRAWMKDSHINAQEAVQACIDLNAHTMIPMHWGTFHLGFDEYYTPIALLQKTWHKMQEQVAMRQLKILKFGELTANFGKSVLFSIGSKLENYHYKNK